VVASAAPPEADLAEAIGAFVTFRTSQNNQLIQADIGTKLIKQSPRGTLSMFVNLPAQETDKYRKARKAGSE